MRQILLSLIVVGIVSTSGLKSSFAQQLPQRRPLTITYHTTSVTKTQWSSDSTSNNSSSSVGGGSIAGQVPNVLPQSDGNGNQNSGNAGFGMNSGGSFSGVNTPPISNQQLQNPSGGFNLSHAGFSQNQYVSPNNYFGPQFQTWSNLGLQPTSTSGSDSFNRYQPATNMNSGAYFTPMTYIGAANNQWSNLSSGVVTPNMNGGWSYGY